MSSSASFQLAIAPVFGRVRAGVLRALALLLGTLALMAGCGVSKQTLPSSVQVDRIVIVKSAHTMALMAHGKVLKVYKVALGRESGVKERRGDHRTPVGLYVVDSKLSKSRFDMALHLSYPNAADRARAKKLGVNPGGDIEIHGVETGLAWLGSAQHAVDWTDGCIAITNPEIEEIWPLVHVGTVVEIRP